MEQEIEYTRDGDISIDGMRLTHEQAQRMLLDLAETGRMRAYLSRPGARAKVPGCAAAIEACWSAGDRDGAFLAFVFLCEAFLSDFAAAPAEGRPPVAPADLVARARERQEQLARLFSACGDMARRQAAPSS